MLISPLSVYSNNLEFFTADTSCIMPLPFVGTGISAGFPSPAEEYIDLSLDLNRELVTNPSSTFYGRVKGSSMKDAGVLDGDVLVIDKSLQPKSGQIAVCYLDGEFTIKYIKITANRCFLIPANDQFPTIEVSEDNDFRIWGIVTYVIKKMA